MKIAEFQMTSGVDPVANGDALVAAIGEAAAHGAVMLFTPEMTGLLDCDGGRAARSVVHETTMSFSVALEMRLSRSVSGYISARSRCVPMVTRDGPTAGF